MRSDEFPLDVATGGSTTPPLLCRMRTFEPLQSTPSVDLKTLLVSLADAPPDHPRVPASLKELAAAHVGSWFFVGCSLGLEDVVDACLECRRVVDGNACVLSANAIGMECEFTPLAWSASHGQDTICSRLLDAGADVDSTIADGATALFIAVEMGHQSTVKLLLDRGANPKLVRRDGDSPLIMAADRGLSSIVRMLLSYGSPVNQISWEDGATPLTVACFMGHEEVVRELLAASADVDHTTRNGETALSLCLKSDASSERIANLLMEAVDGLRFHLRRETQVGMHVGIYEAPHLDVPPPVVRRSRSATATVQLEHDR